MAYESTNYEPLFRWAYYLGIAAIFGGILLFQTHRSPPIPNSAAFGCYSDDSAAPIMLDKSGMHIQQAGFPSIAFHLERHKTGIALTADAPIEANPSGDRYAYSIRPPGEGWYLDFYKDIDGHRYGVFDQADLSRFTMLARDGTYLQYVKGPASACDGRKQTVA